MLLSNVILVAMMISRAVFFCFLSTVHATVVVCSSFLDLPTFVRSAVFILAFTGRILEQGGASD